MRGAELGVYSDAVILYAMFIANYLRCNVGNCHADNTRLFVLFLIQ